jgi:hypothetical protein
MQFTINSNSTDETLTKAEGIALAFETDGNKLIALGPANAPFDVTVQTFDPNRDIFYRAPESLTPEELAAEVEIHVPHSLRQKLNGRLASGTLDGFVLMQNISSACAAISPLTVLKRILRQAGNVNSSILQADHNGILFIRNAGVDYHAGASAHSLKEFLDLSEEERKNVFPDFHASEILLSGSRLDDFENLNLRSLSTSRRIAISDFTGICEFTPEAATLIEANPQLYTLVIGAAAIYAEILQENNSNEK